MSKELNREIRKKFLKYVIPSVLSMWVFTIYTMVDGMFVAKGVGESALAAVNISMPLINITFGLGILFAVGASIKASIFKGENNSYEANKVFTNSFVTVFMLALIFSLITYLNLDYLAKLLGSSNKTHQYVIDYLSIIILFIPFYMTSYNFEVLIKADGFPKKAVVTMLIGAGTNIFLDYIFVIVLSLGVKGAAFATGLSQLFSFMIFLAHFLSSKSSFKFVRIKWSFKKAMSLAKLGIPDSLTEFSIASVIFMYNKTIITHMGNDGIIIYTVIAYVSQLVLMTMIGINQGMQPLVSYYYGQEKPKKYTYIFKVALRLAMLASLTAFLIGIIFPGPIVSLFVDKSKSPQIFLQAIKAFKIFSTSYLPLGIVIVLYGYFTALEKTKYALIISVSRGFVFVALALVILPNVFGELGLWLSMTLSESLSLVLGLILYYKYFKSLSR